MRIAGYQMAVRSDIEVNAVSVCGAIDRAAAGGAEIVLTPEGSLSGYTHEFDARAAEKALEFVTAHARTNGVGLALGT